MLHIKEKITLRSWKIQLEIMEIAIAVTRGRLKCQITAW
jgi:hypothetical protein